MRYTPLKRVLMGGLFGFVPVHEWSMEKKGPKYQEPSTPKGPLTKEPKAQGAQTHTDGNGQTRSVTGPVNARNDMKES
jgi:hypothetical protein